MRRDSPRESQPQGLPKDVTEKAKHGSYRHPDTGRNLAISRAAPSSPPGRHGSATVDGDPRGHHKGGFGFRVILPKFRARCSSVVRVFAHGTMGRRINPSWSGPIELFLVPASASRLV